MCKKAIVLIQPRSAVALLLAFSMLLCGVASRADSNPPERMTYQGFLVDGNGTALGLSAPKNYDVVFRIYDAQTAGNLKWSEQQTVTVDKGYFSVLLGEGSQVGSEGRPALSTVFLGTTASDRFVGLTVKGIGAGGADVAILPRLRMLTAPYAYLARNAVSAGNLVNSTDSQVVSVVGSNVGINKAVPGSALDVTGTVTATAFSGNGAALTALNASSISSGTLADARLSGNVARLNVVQTFASRPTFNAGLNLNAQPLFIRGQDDPNHVLKSILSFGGMAGQDGPLLAGYAGGILGRNHNGEFADLLWNSQGVTITGQPASHPNTGTSQTLAQQLTIQARDIQNTGIRLALGMSHVNGVEHAGIIQAYSSATGPATLRLNPKGGSVSAGGTLSVNGQLNVNGSGGGDILATMQSTGQSYLLWLYRSGGTLDYSFGAGGSALKTGGTSWGSLSDARLKHNIQDISGALNQLLQLRAVTFEFNDPARLGAGIQTGFIAQEVEQVFPTWVSETPDKMKAVTPRGFEALTVQSLRELRAEKDAQVRELTEENAALKQRLADLERIVNAMVAGKPAGKN